MRDTIIYVTERRTGEWLQEVLFIAGKYDFIMNTDQREAIQFEHHESAYVSILCDEMRQMGMNPYAPLYPRMER